MQLVEAEKTDYAGITSKLSGMKVSDKTALEVDMAQAGSVRTIISKLHKETDLRFTTSKSQSGIMVWRVA